LGAVDRAHATLADHLDYLVGTEERVSNERHRNIIAGAALQA
jgi:hypothetical protein